MVCLPCRQLKHTPGKPDSSLVWSSHLKNSDLNSIPVSFRCLLFSMACCSWLRLTYSLSHPAASLAQPLRKTQPTFPPPSSSDADQRTAGCPSMQRVTRESQACAGLSSVLPCPSVHLNVCAGPSAFHTVPFVPVLQAVSDTIHWAGGARVETLPGSCATAAGLGSEFVDIKYDPHALFNTLLSPKGH